MPARAISAIAVFARRPSPSPQHLLCRLGKHNIFSAGPANTTADTTEPWRKDWAGGSQGSRSGAPFADERQALGHRHSFGGGQLLRRRCEGKAQAGTSQYQLQQTQEAQTRGPPRRQSRCPWTGRQCGFFARSSRKIAMIKPASAGVRASSISYAA